MVSWRDILEIDEHKLIHPFWHFCFSFWRGETQKAAQQKQETTEVQGSADQEAEDQTADQREDVTVQSSHHRSVSVLVLIHLIQKHKNFRKLYKSYFLFTG